MRRIGEKTDKMQGADRRQNAEKEQQCVVLNLTHHLKNIHILCVAAFEHIKMG